MYVKDLDLHTIHIYSLYVHFLNMINLLMSSDLMISTIVARSQSPVYLFTATHVDGYRLYIYGQCHDICISIFWLAQLMQVLFLTNITT